MNQEVAAFQTVPVKRYRLFDGTIGTEYEACVETLAELEAARLLLEENIELLRQRMELAEGRP